MKELNDPKDVCVNVHQIPITENRMNSINKFHLSINFVCVFFLRKFISFKREAMRA